MKWLAVLLLLLAAPLAAQQPRLITDLSQSRIDISHRFAGGELLIFGAIQYPGGRTPKEPPGIAIILRSPVEPLTVRRKERVAGIWVNTEAMQFSSIPGYYAVATNQPIRDLLDERNAAIYEIGLSHLQLSPTTTADTGLVTEFERGLTSLRARQGLFVEQPEGVQVTDNVLYRARFPIPSSVPVGAYEVQIYLISDGEVRARSVTSVEVDKAGFERTTFLFAQQHGFLYGLLAVAMAIFMGTVAGTIGIRRSR